MKLKFQESFERGGFDVFAIEEREDGPYALNISVSHGMKVFEGMEYPKAAFIPHAKMKPLARDIIDALTEAGFNPAVESDRQAIKSLRAELDERKRSHEAELKATKDHLADMKRAYDAIIARFQRSTELGPVFQGDQP